MFRFAGQYSKLSIAYAIQTSLSIVYSVGTNIFAFVQFMFFNRIQFSHIVSVSLKKNTILDSNNFKNHKTAVSKMGYIMPLSYEFLEYIVSILISQWWMRGTKLFIGVLVNQISEN